MKTSSKTSQGVDMWRLQVMGCAVLLSALAACGGDTSATSAPVSDDGVGDAGVEDASQVSDAEPSSDVGSNADVAEEPDLVEVDDPPQGDGASCEGLDAICGGEDCCAVREVPGGVFSMGRGESGADAFPEGFVDETPEHEVSVSAFGLDRFEVTVGRMRRFVDAYQGPPDATAGAHPLIQGTGWKSAWDVEMPADRAALVAQLTELAPFCNWTDAPGEREAAPVNCVSWYVAFAFCAWDGGRLPTEAEFEFAAAGGDEDRLYPWGAQEPDETLANFGGLDAFVSIPVGSKPSGAGRWGHDDLGGGMWKWVFDAYDEAWYAGAGADCQDCANTLDTGRSAYRGGSWTGGGAALRAAIRNNFGRHNTNNNLGFRCAR